MQAVNIYCLKLKLTIIDLFDENNNAIGTSVEFFIPLQA